MEKSGKEESCESLGPGGALLKELSELGTKTDRLDSQLILLALLSGLVALFGLFLNNVSVIIGAMVISPLLEPMYAGVVRMAGRQLRASMKHLAVLGGLLGVIVLMAFLVTIVCAQFSVLQITPEITSRTTRIDLYTVLAVILGVVAVLSHKRGFISSVIGVGIAVALVPPAVVVGITMAIYPIGFLAALQLTLNNIFGMLAGMLIGVIFLGTGGRCKGQERISRGMLYSMLAAVLVLLLILFLMNYIPWSLGYDVEDVIAKAI